MNIRRNELPENLQKILRDRDYVTIATICADGQPWNTPVFARFDDDLNLYWVSSKQSQHSKNIDYEPRIFVVVYDSTVPEGEGLGVYLRMKARLLTNSQDIERASEVYDTRFFKHDFAKHDQFLADCPQGFYTAEPEQVWFNTDSEADRHFVDVRQEVAKPR
jgi:general stress protein 26